jgi:hypothetical protein
MMQCRFQMMFDTVGRKARAASDKPRPGAGVVPGEESSGITRCLCEGFVVDVFMLLRSDERTKINNELNR